MCVRGQVLGNYTWQATHQECSQQLPGLRLCNSARGSGAVPRFTEAPSRSPEVTNRSSGCTIRRQSLEPQQSVTAVRVRVLSPSRSLGSTPQHYKHIANQRKFYLLSNHPIHYVGEEMKWGKTPTRALHKRTKGSLSFFISFLLSRCWAECLVGMYDYEWKYRKASCTPCGCLGVGG